MSIADIIDSAYPSDEAEGIPLNSQIKIIFNTEIDEWSIENGGIILEGPDTDELIITPYTPSVINQGSEQQILETPGLKGLVPGTFSFERVALDSNTLVSTLDTIGDGTLYRTKAIFTPLYPLKKNTEYTVYVIGGDTDEQAGIFTNTVFDVVANVGNTGNGECTFSGTYLGDLSQDTINIKITKAGVTGVAEFEAWKTSAPLELSGPFLTSNNFSHIFEGITIAFNDGGSFDVDDEFSVKVKAPTTFSGTVISTFTTGAGSITSLPTSASTSILGDPLYTPSVGFDVFKTTPVDGETNRDISKNRITIEFTSEIDVSTITDETVQILVEPVSDHPSITNIPTGNLHRTITVSGLKMFIDL